MAETKTIQQKTERLAALIGWQKVGPHQWRRPDGQTVDVLLGWKPLERLDHCEAIMDWLEAYREHPGVVSGVDVVFPSTRSSGGHRTCELSWYGPWDYRTRRGPSRAAAFCEAVLAEFGGREDSPIAGEERG